MSSLLIHFFEHEYLEVNTQLLPVEVKRYRNAIGRGSQLLEHPIEYIDAIELSFRNWFVENLLRLDFTMERAEEFAVCVEKVTKAMREAKRAKPRPEPNMVDQASEWLQNHRGTIAEALTTDLLFDGDQICIGSIHELESVQQFIDAGHEPELQETKPGEAE